jgi:uncharacterized protein (TIGR03435 family)
MCTYIPRCTFFAASVTLLTVLTVVPIRLVAQTSEKFEVVSVKRSPPPNPVTGAFAQITIQPGRFRASNATLRDLVRRAYDVMDFQIVGELPQWASQNRFDVNATTDGTTDRAHALAMLRSLLADRFSLRSHSETRDLPVYNLQLTREDRRLGPQLRRTTAECEQLHADNAASDRQPAAPGAPRCTTSMSSVGSIKAEGYTLAELAKTLTPLVGRLVFDRTALTGRYDWQVDFDPEAIRRMNVAMGLPQLPFGANGPALDKPPIEVALRDQLGLVLQPATGPVPVVVIESAAPPTPD